MMNQEEIDMATHWEKNYTELAEAGRPNVYDAIVRDHHWKGCFLFRAIYNSGGSCTECVSEDKDELIAMANRWLAGEMPEGFYSSSF